MIFGIKNGEIHHFTCIFGVDFLREKALLLGTNYELIKFK